MKKNLIAILSVIAALAAGAAGHSVLDPSAAPVVYRYDCSQVPALKVAVKPPEAPVSEEPKPEEPAPVPVSE